MEKRKHIFFVHSAVTYWVANEIIEKKQLQATQFLFLTYRGFQVPQYSFESHVFPYALLPEPFPFKLNFLKSWAKVRQFDQFINGLTQHVDYHAYLPHTASRSMKLLITHPRCVGFSFIEEGMASYLREEQINQAPYHGSVHPLDRLLNRNRIPDRLFFSKNYDAVYGLYEEAFPAFRNRIILKQEGKPPPGFIEKYAKKQQVEKYNNAHILVLDAVSVYGLVKRGVHLYAFFKVLRQLEKAGVKKVYVKYHPSQIGTEEHAMFRKTAELFSKSFLLEEVGPEVFLEVVAYSSIKVKFYINWSSVGLYAAKAGHEIYSWAPYIMELDDSFRKEFSRIPPVLLENIQLLKEGVKDGERMDETA